ncbi:hypothetical protein P153DRAFT_368100, partial [Dothidotthia symphoricarpi CBS 119687]
MHFSIPFSLLLLPVLTVSSPVALAPTVLPTGQDVKQDVYNIDAAVKALDASVRAFNGGTPQTAIVEGTPVLLSVAEIHRVNRVGFGHALLALPFSVQDSVDVINAVVSTG